MRRFRAERGFTLTNILVLIALAGAGYLAWNQHAKKQGQQTNSRAAEVAAKKVRDLFESQLRNRLTWKNTLAAPENTPFTCLRLQSSCSGKSGPIAVRDPQNRVLYNPKIATSGFTFEGGVCSSFQDSGSDECPFRVELAWEYRCTGDCVEPKFGNITVSLRFRPGPGKNGTLNESLYNFALQLPTESSDPRSCLEHQRSSRGSDGIYLIRPDPDAPSFPVYCDQTRDGGGWTLAVNATRTEYGPIDEEYTLTPSTHGRLSATRIAAILQASESQNDNNLRLTLPDVDGGLVLGAGANGGTEAATYRGDIPAGDCRAVPAEDNFAKKYDSPIFAVELSGNGAVGFRDATEGLAGYRGFYACFGDELADAACGTGCNRKWTGSLLRQRGSLWIK